MSTAKSKGYIALLKRNRSFRNLWYGQVVSELGDWLNSIAIYALILQLTGSGMAMAAAMMAKLLPFFFISPVAGVMVDRLDRKKVMIVSDLLRFFVVLGFLFVDEPDELWLVYTLTVLEICLSGFFEPARSALIPSLIQRKDLVTANALSGSTWSMMLAFGAALGGLIVALLGTRTAFILDAFTFLISAWFIYRISEKDSTVDKDATEIGTSGFKGLMDGVRYLKQNPLILALASVKSGLAVTGGIMTLIPLYANKLLSAPSAISLAIGAMYCSRGIGAAIGPILVNRIFGDSSKLLRKAIGISFFLSAGSAMLLSLTQNLWTASLTIGMITLFGSIIWVFSSALIHLEADPKFYGRIFSTEMGVMTLFMGFSNWAVGYAVDGLEMTPGQIAIRMGVFMLIPGLLWTWFSLSQRNRLKEEPCIASECPVDPSGFNPTPTNPLKPKGSAE
jgi:MFS family permease